ncbi:MAG: hypothetical protein PHR77_06065 [Kiritimatiellae bacterium]|nr:hypothetical protein [Kiritimatiellia bacterium]MDD5520500.1 hypothetical protein [Kiritimatiellia bacterium]
MRIIYYALFLIGVATSQTAFSASISLSLPELPWSLEIATPGFTVEKMDISPDGAAARLQARNKASSVILSVFLEPAAQKGDSKACREYYWNRAKQSPIKKEQISMHETGSIAVVEYIATEYLGRKTNQKNLNAYLAEGEYWIDVHLSKTDDEGTLQSILKSIRINPTYIPTASDRFDFGNIYFKQKNYKKAVTQYENAFVLEKQKSSLPRNTWIVLVDQLGMSYGISGDLAKSKQLLKWAISKEPEYPMFYYNLACTFAEMDNFEEALQNLRLAYKYKHNSLPGESVPNPRTDSSFAKYLSNPVFSTELNKMK